MLQYSNVLLIVLLLIGCTTPSKEQKGFEATDVVTESKPNIFADSNFTFIELDSLSEDMLRDKSEKGKRMYISSIKKMKKAHYRFFNFHGPDGSFWDDYFFLISRQKTVSGIKPVIIHFSLDFGFYTSVLYTLDSENRKIDSVEVASDNFSSGGDTDIDEITKSWSVFEDEFITTMSVEYQRFGGDSTVTTDSTVFYRKIRNDGSIETIKTDKFYTNQTNVGHEEKNVVKEFYAWYINDAHKNKFGYYQVPSFKKMDTSTYVFDKDVLAKRLNTIPYFSKSFKNALLQKLESCNQKMEKIEWEFEPEPEFNIDECNYLWFDNWVGGQGEDIDGFNIISEVSKEHATEFVVEILINKKAFTKSKVLVSKEGNYYKIDNIQLDWN